MSAGGGITNLDKRIHIENATKQKGSYNLSYVSQIDGNLITYLFSYIIPSWDIEKVNDYKVSDYETTEDIEQRGKLSLNTTKACDWFADKIHAVIYKHDSTNNTNTQVADIILDD